MSESYSDPNSIPNPGTGEALQRGCKCPVLDNHHGDGITINGETAWWVSSECPLHGHGLREILEAEELEN